MKSEKNGTLGILISKLVFISTFWRKLLFKEICFLQNLGSFENLHTGSQNFTRVY